MMSRLADFIESNLPELLERWDSFAVTLLPAGSMDARELRDHAEQMLRVIAQDLRTPQTPEAQRAKSRGEAPRLDATHTAAESHALLRAASGFNVQQLIAEYRALRASVLSLWGDTHPTGDDVLEDIGRFNEAIDQAVAESVQAFASELDRWRNLFLGVLGHDLRGPLGAILLTSKQISMLSDGQPLKEPAERLMRSGQRMQQLLDDLLDYSRTSLDVGLSVRPAPLDLAEACREEIDLQQATYPGTKIDLAVVGSPHGCWDGSRLRQLIGNLVGNALTHGTSGTSIHVTVRGLDPDQVELRVENDGEIPKPLLPTLFEPLHRGATEPLPQSRAHLGLGLFIVREVAQAHGGSVSATSANGRTAFNVVLPRNGARNSR